MSEPVMVENSTGASPLPQTVVLSYLTTMTTTFSWDYASAQPRSALWQSLEPGS